MLVSIAAPALAQQAPPPVEVRVEGVLGNEALIGDGYSTVAVTVRNLTRETFRGRLVVRTSQWNQPPDRHAVPLDLPPAEQRRVLITLFVNGSGTQIEARYEAGDALLGSASMSSAYAPSGRSLVVLADPSRLRATLLDLQASVPDENPGYYGAATGSERAVQVPIGTITIDGTTGDPIVPDDVLGYSTVAVLAAQASMLTRLSDRELDAIRRWVHAGGHLVIFPRSEGDLATPLVRETFGAVRYSETRRLVPGDFAPGALPALECARGATERFGCADRVGAGAVYVTAYDASAPPHVDRPEVRELLRSIAQRALRDPATTRFTLGRGIDSLEQTWWDGRPSLARLRAALDPNEGYRPALGLVGIVLFLYVIVVGPLNFRFVLQRNRPTLALVSTPILAIGCATVMLVVGYLGKGVTMRYRRVEIVEAVEGDTLAPTRAYAGYFLTAPSTVEIATREGGRTMRLASGGGDDGLVYDHAGERPRLTSLRGGLWETIFLRDDRVIDLGAPIRFAYEGDRLVSITNESQRPLRSAFIVDESRVYAIGDVEAGATRPIPASAATVLSSGWGFDEEENPTPRDIARQLGLEEDDARYVRGVLRLIGGPSPSPSEPLLWARLDPEPSVESEPTFGAETDLRFVLLHPRPRYDLLGRAAPPPTDGSVWGEPTEAPPTELLPPPTNGASPDGGVP
ncbi:hypothetical protein [Sandaracinus amylolyticus]|uniref:hypothetical protein n=1 Tax=Sandaracinus amylolyticus TaxID=927083 RepID=UPI001F1E7D05|nr:hypothetical protein [Sandaracinus amylolyticus]UJR79738.1 Hypothetical protein I5071_17760 [Sandaracinus amylolyticus]